MLSTDTVSEKIFKILKGNGYEIKIFTDEGDSTIDPLQARRFYVPSMFAMINMDETDSRREIKASISAGTDMDKFRTTLDQIRNLANRSVIEYTLKQYAKNITPKDFDFQAQKIKKQKQVQEGFGPVYGSKKSSYQQLESAKLIIKHKKAVGEQRGSRSRNIHSIFVENSEGERYKFPYNNLTGARAMLRHVKEGGTPYDQFGSHIVEQCREYKKLKEFKRYTQKNKLINENTAHIIEAVDNRIKELKNNLHKTSGKNNYRFIRDSFEGLTEQDNTFTFPSMSTGTPTRPVPRPNVQQRQNPTDPRAMDTRFYVDSEDRIANSTMPGLTSQRQQDLEHLGYDRWEHSLQQGVDPNRLPDRTSGRMRSDPSTWSDPADMYDPESEPRYLGSSVDNSTENAIVETHLQDLFTVKYFDDSLEEALPYVQALADQINQKNREIEAAKTILNDLVDCINRQQAITTHPEIDIVNDPENPFVAGDVSNVGNVLTYLSSVLYNQDDVASLLSQSADILAKVEDPSVLGNSVNAVKMILPKLKKYDQSGTQSVIVGESVAVNDIVSALSKYDISRLFS